MTKSSSSRRRVAIIDGISLFHFGTIVHRLGIDGATATIAIGAGVAAAVIDPLCNLFQSREHSIER